MVRSIPSFGGNSTGVFTKASGGSFDRAQALAVDADGAIFAGGTTSVGGAANEGAVVKLTPAGQIDSSFGSGGIVELNLFGFLYDIEAQPTGAVLVGGAANGFAVARLDVSGALDTNFGAGSGFVQITNVGSNMLFSSSGQAVGSDGSILCRRRSDGPDRLLRVRSRSLYQHRRD